MSLLTIIGFGYKNQPIWDYINLIFRGYLGYNKNNRESNVLHSPQYLLGQHVFFHSSFRSCPSLSHWSFKQFLKWEFLSLPDLMLRPPPPIYLIKHCKDRELYPSFDAFQWYLCKKNKKNKKK